MISIPKAFVALALSFMLFGASRLGAVALAQSQTPSSAAPPGAATALKASNPATSSQQSAACQADQQGNDTGQAAEQEKASETETMAAHENTAADPDNVQVQCGDQQQDSQAMTMNGQHALAAQHTGKVAFLRAQLNPSGTAQAATAQAGTENEQAAETETGASNDQATDHVVCDQQGQHDGNNVGC